jgi:hypothetical protein
MTVRKNKKPSKANEVSEPVINYPDLPSSNKNITIFNSHVEMEEENYKWLASLTPEQHLQNATALIKRIFADDLKKNPLIGNKLLID